MKCDRCGREMNSSWELPGEGDTEGIIGGNCPQCGDDLCSECAGRWHEDEDSICDRCSHDNECSMCRYEDDMCHRYDSDADGNCRNFQKIVSKYFISTYESYHSMFKTDKWYAVYDERGERRGEERTVALFANEADAEAFTEQKNREAGA